MIEFYPQIKLVHICAVLASGTLFLLRGLSVQLGVRTAIAAPVRYFSYGIDTVLLTSALMLMSVLHQYPFINSWLTVKLTLVVVYIVVGSFAIRRGRTRAVRLTCWIAALLLYGMIISVAVTHDPFASLRTAGRDALPCEPRVGMSFKFHSLARTP